MPTLFTNALLTDLDPPNVESGSLRIDGGKIVARGKLQASPGDDVIDCHGAIVLPGLVNGHTHLYSALAVGMPAPPRVPQNFLEILQLVWWRLDVALDLESIETSARIGALDALACGTTTLIDHHASPSAIERSLDAVERGISDVGLRAVLCYELTDRAGMAGRDAGLEESRRYIEKCKTRGDGRFAALVGAHASFTLSDESLAQIASLNAPVHIHVAEDQCDTPNVIDRLARFGLLKSSAIFAHCIHLTDAEIARCKEVGVTIAHNPRSNMNNAVGYAPISKVASQAMLGTDGIGADMFAEAKHAWFKSRDASAGISGAGISPDDVLKMLANSARRASTALGVTIGRLEVGAEADIVFTDYAPFTPIDSSTLAAHFIFAMSSRNVRDVMIAGQWKMRDRTIESIDALAAKREANRVAAALWRRMPPEAFPFP